MEVFSIKGILIEIIEVFGELLIIQEVISKIIRTIFYYELDQMTENSKIEEKSNVYSLDWWKKCQKSEKKLKPNRYNQHQSSLKQPKLKKLIPH